MFGDLLELLAAMLPHEPKLPEPAEPAENEIKRVSDDTAVLGNRLAAMATPVNKQRAE
jgi:hypothetical protein